ncbi:hypothetical protein FT663_03022 [Candidozyma haemuli var. vulneris]|uniref:Potassium channel tetramerisation-type BTB domain-containing protein n=1 Tax=Candidozyma haemuli TaxID=45357 RepID=A0A2V1ARU9_9ASCO|nr:hypothetical protein CXQ85_001780 [[Candida] haemuloni]KAF3990622.1 hypothetical protein FT662_02183 [[Candida] haemuloni var. vulneris]KAF3990756.1 hypothetical protein FT663_03022 [[Candida] haemuloni var. vulneris]PVH20003.1 hypothetical protein CXQ85_001780 [[Candida] haemuloni]
MELSDEFDPSIPVILPHENVYLIQVGYKLFRFSGASLSSDAPSYFTNYFLNSQNAEKVLYIDRNPQVFEKIFSHLQGYHIDVEDAHEYVYLWSDSYYFGLRRLQKLLDSEFTFACIGNESFKIPKQLFDRTNNYPNYFSINFDSLLSDNRKIIQSKSMLRPPPQRPPMAPLRSSKLFGDLLEILKGNDSTIKDDEHRQALLKECRYYRFLELEQRLLKHELISNPFTKEQEIVLNLFDLQPKGVVSRSTGYHDELPLRYTRPYMIKEKERSLIVQVTLEAGSTCKLALNRDSHLTSLVCTGKIANAFHNVFGSFAKDLSLEHQQEVHGQGSNKFITLCGLSNAATVLNGKELKDDWFLDWFKQPEEPSNKKRKADNGSPDEDELVEFPLTKSLWRVLVRGDRCRFHAVSLVGYTGQAAFNKSIKLL